MMEFNCDMCETDLNENPKSDVFHASGIIDGEASGHIHLCYPCYFKKFGKLKRIKRVGSCSVEYKKPKFTPPPQNPNNE